METNIIEDSISLFLKPRNDRKPHKERYFPAQASAFINKEKFKKLEGRCLRSSYYSCMGVEEILDNDTSKGLVMSLGDYTEDMLLNIFARTSVLVEKGVKFEIEEYRIAGKLDAILKDGDAEVGLEIKSIGSNKWTVGSIFGSAWNKPTPKWQHLFQTLIYCYAFKERLSYFLLCYISRDTGKRQTFKISIEPIKDKMYCSIDGTIDYSFTVNDILERYKLLNSFVLSEKVPPKEFQKVYDKKDIPDYLKVGFISKKQAEYFNVKPFGDYECLYCGYRDQCDKDK